MDRVWTRSGHLLLAAWAETQDEVAILTAHGGSGEVHDPPSKYTRTSLLLRAVKLGRKSSYVTDRNDDICSETSKWVNVAVRVPLLKRAADGLPLAPSQTATELVELTEG